MRHLHFTQSLEPLYGGGLGASALALHRQMQSMGLESRLCTTCAGEPQNHIEGSYEFRRIKPDFLYFAPRLRACGRDLVASVDVLHGHGLYVGTNYILGAEARRQKKPLVYHVHGMFEPYILERSRWKKQLVHWLFEDANFRSVKLWRALTAKEADQIRGCGISSPIVVAPNGLNLGEYRRVGEPESKIRTPLVPELVKNRPRVLFLSRVHPKKGLDVLLPAWARVSQAHKDWELVIAGPDEQGYLSSIRDVAEQLGIEGRITFTGSVTGITKTKILYSADLFVLPSYSEGLPVSLLEAMACEVPVIATKQCNCPDIAPAGAGWLCEPTVDSLSEALSTALNAADLERRQRGTKGKQLVEKSFSWPKIASEIIRACDAHCQ